MSKVIFLMSAMWSISAYAQVPVVEAGTNSRGPVNSVAAASSGNELAITIYNQLEALQQEVQTLRGKVEEQDYQIKRMQTEQRDRYLDIDRRLSSASQADIAGPIPGAGAIAPPSSVIPAPAATPEISSPPPQAGGAAGTAANPPSALNAPASTAAVTAAAPPAAQLDEQELYRTALNLLLEQSNYQQAIQYFQSYITSYPQGRYLTNSYYWQGEAYILVEQFREARDVFSKILSQFPQDPKAAGAMLKLGVAYQKMGELDMARQTWQEIAVRYPESTTEIREAANNLRK